VATRSKSIDPDYFVALAEAAGLRLVERLGAVCGQESFLFQACASTSALGH
jgi:hypothetical protein